MEIILKCEEIEDLPGVRSWVTYIDKEEDIGGFNSFGLTINTMVSLGLLNQNKLWNSYTKCDKDIIIDRRTKNV